MIKCAIGIIFLIQFTLVNYSQQQYNNQPVSPCPQVFEYRYDGNDWYGVITVNSPRLEQREVTLHLTLSLRASTTQNNVGAISLLDSTQETTNNIINQRPIRYRVQFPFRYPIPKVVQIIHDNNLICAGSAEDPNAGGVVSRIELKHVMNTFTTIYNGNSPQPQPVQPDYYQPQAPPTYQPQQPTYQPQPQAPPTYQPQPQPQPPTYQPQQPTYQQPYNPYAPPPQPKPSTTYSPPTQSTPSYAPISTNQEVDSVCGQRQSDSAVSGFVFGGEETRRGDWPWMVAIYLNKPTGLSFTCGGSLVSSRAVVTAAHCINTSAKNYQPHEVVLWLGRYKLTDWTEPGAISSYVETIHIHSDYMRQRDSYDADLAVLVLQQQVQFTQYIRPICLWPSVQGTNDVEGHKGTVVGWGKDTDRTVSNVPKKIDLPIVNSLTCIQTTEALSKTISHRTFCAGTLDGSGPCNGDSGGGLSLLRQSRWTLRGIVSAGLSDINTNSCKLTDYVVFTDISKFTDWIRVYM